MTELERSTAEKNLLRAARLDSDAAAGMILANLRRNLFSADEPPAKVGHYELRSALGQGAMGTVFEAFDPVLHRRVALKILNKRPGVSQETQLSEARALAKLAHPNVVAVFEAGSTGEQVYIAMELVDGVDLAGWLQQAQRGWEEIIAVFGAAARGLAAAHDAGLVHGDFKPANVLLSDTRVCVADFGMVRDTSVDALIVSASGGTPMYMAPERLDGAAASPASDQFAFFVSLLEAINGEAPFQATTLEGLRSSMANTHDLPPFDTSVPRWLRDAILRGLHLDPASRFPTMRDVAQTLLRPRAAIRRRRLTAAAALIVVGGGAAWAGSASSATAPPCTGARAELDEIWSPARRTALAEAYAASDAGTFAADVWARTEQALEAYAGAWASARTEACLATTVRGERSAEILDRSMICLQRAATNLQSVITQLGQADERTIRNAHKIVAGLPALEPCGDLEALQQEVAPPPADEAEAVESIHALLARAQAARNAGHYDEADDAVSDAEDALASVTYEPVADNVALSRGSVASSQGNFEVAEQAFSRALEGAAQRRRWAIMADASADLMRVVGDDLGRHEEGLRHAIVARGLARGDSRRESVVENNLGAILLGKGDHDGAEAALRRGLELRLQTAEPDHPDVLTARGNLAAILSAKGKFAEAEAEFRALVAQSTDVLGPDHPGTGVRINNLTLALYRQGKHEEAAELGNALLQTRIRTLGPEHPHVAVSQKQVAASLSALGKHDEAVALMRDSIALHETIYGRDHASTAGAYGVVVALLLEQGKFREAERQAQTELAIRLKTQGPEHPDLGGTYQNRALALRGLQRFDDAAAAFEQALSVRIKALGPDHAFVAHIRSNIAETHLKQRRYAEAETYSRDALEGFQKTFDDDNPQVIRARWNLAQALVNQERWEDARAAGKLTLEAKKRTGARPTAIADAAYLYALAQWNSSTDAEGRALARALMREAKSGYEQASTPDKKLAGGIADAEQWLREHS